MNSSSLRIVDCQISNNWSIFFTRYAFSCMGEIVAFVSQYPKSPKVMLLDTVYCYIHVTK